MEAKVVGGYRLKGPVISTGTAEVFRGMRHHERGVEHVTIKHLAPQYKNDRILLEMFQDECRISMAMDHPQVVGGLESGTTETGPYLVLEPFDGFTLSEILRRCHERRVPIPQELSAYVIAQVLWILGDLHQARWPGTEVPMELVHRGLCPANVILCMDGSVKIWDFSIALASGNKHQPQPGWLYGRYSYMSPEQARGETVTQSTDLFAAGIMLYELLTGIRPFRGSNELAVLDRVRSGNFAPPMEINPFIPPMLAHAIEKTMQPKPHQRFENAKELAACVEAAFDNAAFKRPDPKAVVRFLGQALTRRDS
jgi:serine/threonine-protein kinase